jgi:small subunit ribosomal protein S6
VNPYEILLMLDPDLTEERQAEIVQRMRESIEKAGGTWVGHDPWGQRRLTYEIDKKHDGTYHLVNFDSDPATLDELSRVLRITDGVMRHLPVRRIVRSSEPRREGAEPPAVRDAPSGPRGSLANGRSTREGDR